MGQRSTQFCVQAKRGLWVFYVSIVKNVSCHSGKGKTIGIENRSVVARDWGAGRGCLQKDMKECVGVMEMFCILIMMVVTQLYVFVKIQRTVHIKG